MAEVDQAFTDDELTELALAADPEAGVAVPMGELMGSEGWTGAGELLPGWYMPPPIGSSRLLRGWRRRIVLLIVASFVLINAYGLCSAGPGLLGPALGGDGPLTADRVDPARRRILVDRQVVEGRNGLALSPPKNRRKRTTMYPAGTPASTELGQLLARRLAEVAPDGLVFPSPRGTWARRSNYGATPSTPPPTPPAGPGGPTDGGRGRSTPCATSSHLGPVPARGPHEDVSRLLGHSTVRVTQDLYISADGDLYERFYRATE